MQLFELLLLASTTVILLFGRYFKQKINLNYLIVSLFAILGIHLIFEGYRWQMIPGYLLWALALWAAFASSTTNHIIIRILKATGVSFLFILVYLLATILPVFRLPKPMGKYTVGTQDIHLKLDRKEVITADKNDQRELMIKAWYPSDAQSGKPDPYADRGGRAGFAIKYGLPPFTMNYLNLVKTHVFREIAIAEGEFPVLIFSHGYHSKANGYYALLSEIASQGYVIFAINHTYESTGSTFPDGSIRAFDMKYAREIEANSWDTIKPVIEAFKNGLSFEDRHPIVKKALVNYFVRDMEERWAKDISDVISQLKNWNQSGFFKSHLEVENVGVFGHSRGGGSAGEALRSDARIKAAANIDGVQWGEIVDTSFQQPFLFISSDWPPEHQDLNSHAYINKSTSVFYEAKLLQSGHSSFMDIPFMVRLNALSGAGAIQPKLAIEITNQLVIGFFDKHLKGENVAIEQLRDKYKQLELQVFEGEN